MTSSIPSRRTFLGQSLAVGTAAAPWFIPSTVLGGPQRTGANDRIQVGVIGCGVRGKYLIANLPESARVVSLCDCSLSQVQSARQPTGVFNKVLAKFAETDAPHCSIYQDYRRMLAEESALDAVIIAAPDHHHAQAMILACRAGLDVYVEKPLSVTISEGRAMVEAARKYDRVVQVGSQQRTMEVNRQACEFLKGGGLGKITRVEARNYPGPMPIVNRRAEPIPDDLDWNLFCGPTELRPYHRDLWVKDAYKFGYLTWRGWDLWRDYSGHLTTNWGAHSLDMVQYSLGTDGTGPVEIRLERPLLERWKARIDDQWHEKTPPLGTLKEKQTDKLRFCPVTMAYADGTKLQMDPSVTDNVFYGEQGTLGMGRNSYRVQPKGCCRRPTHRRRTVGKGTDTWPGRIWRTGWSASARAASRTPRSRWGIGRSPSATGEPGPRAGPVAPLGPAGRAIRRRRGGKPPAQPSPPGRF